MNRFARVLLPATILGLLALPAAGGELIVEIEGIRSNEGQILVGVHHRKAGIRFPDRGGIITGTSSPARSGQLRVVFRDLPEGRYAVTAFHDENNNGEIDRNMMGLPIEGYGFSNDAVGFQGPPGFEAAAVAVDGGQSTTKMVLVY